MALLLVQAPAPVLISVLVLVPALALAQVQSATLVPVLVLVPALAQAQVRVQVMALPLAQVPVLVQAPAQVQALAQQAFSVHKVPLLAVVYKSLVSFDKTAITGDSHTIGKPNPQFWLFPDHN
jgi:hypothetical protein